MGEPTVLTDTQLWSLVVAFISATFVIPMIQQPKWSRPTRAAVTFLYSVVVGTVTAWLSGAFDGIHDVRNAASAVLLMLVGAITFYKGFGEPTGIAPTIEHLTSSAP